MTIEAALVLPLFLFLFLNLFSVMEMYRLHATLTSALWNSGRQLAQYTYLYDTYGAEHEALNELVGVALTETYVRGTIREHLDTMGSSDLVLPSGEWGIGLLGTDLSKANGEIGIYATYQARPLCRLYPGMSFFQQARYCGHAWTGYELTGESIQLDQSAEEIVYVTETGTVYHKNRGCTYLNPSIRLVSASDLADERNASGGTYHACPVCHPGSQSTYYVTEYGTVYHSTTGCSSLKRSISAIPISEVGARGPCSKCGQGH